MRNAGTGSWHVIVLAVEARISPKHHNATVKKSCPSSSIVAHQCASTGAILSTEPQRGDMVEHRELDKHSAIVAVATAAGWHFQVRNLLIVVAQGLDKLVLVHLGTSLDADLPGALLQVLL